MKGLLLAVIMCGVVTVSAEEIRLGAGVSLKEATPIASVVMKPEEFVGKTIRIDGIATAVCEEMGCWMSVAADNDPEGKTVRLKVEDGVIVFPVTAKGKQVSAEGVFEEVTPEAAKAAAAEHAAHHPQATPDPKAKPDAHAAHAAPATPHAGEHNAAHAAKTYQIKATGAVIK
jgi:hypothetical protein